MPRALSFVAGSLALALQISSTAVQASEDFFSDITVDVDNTDIDKAVDFKAFVQQKFKYALGESNSEFQHPRQDKGLYQIRTDLFGEFSGDLNDAWKYRLSSKAELNYLQWENNHDEYKLNETRLFLRDAFVDASFSNGHWLRLGNQVFAWGESESLSISDVLSPLDQREFGQVELQDIREQIPALMYSLPALGGKISHVITYKAGANRYANTTSNFYPYVELNGTGIDVVKEDPTQEWELALKYDRQFNGGDFSLVIAEVNDNDYVFNGLSETASGAQLKLSQERQTMAASSVNRVFDAWLFKAELGYFHNQSYTLGFEHAQTNQIRGMLGAVYSGIQNWRMSLEINGLKDNRTPELSDNMSDSRNLGALGVTAHVQHSALNDRVDQHLWLISLPDDDGQIYRWDINYDWSDNWAFSANMVLYDGEQDALLYPYQGNDTVNISAKYSF